MHLYRIVWWNDEVQYLKGTCLADALDRGGRYIRSALKEYEQVD